MPSAHDIRKGQVIKFNGEPHLVMETMHRTPGNLRAFVQVKMRNLRYGKALDQRFASTDTIELLPTEKKTLEFSYADRGTYAFMDPESFETIELPETLIGDSKNYLTANGKVDVLFVDEKPLTIELPSAVNLKVTESSDGVKGDTASNVQKPATLGELLGVERALESFGERIDGPLYKIATALAVMCLTAHAGTPR
jgi:elongation factor P